MVRCLDHTEDKANSAVFVYQQPTNTGAAVVQMETPPTDASHSEQPDLMLPELGELALLWGCQRCLANRGGQSRGFQS